MTRPAPIDGPALREVTVRDYRRNAERAGVPVDLAAIEALALADCNTYAAVMRDRHPAAPAAPDPAKEAERAGALDAAVGAVGAEVVREPMKAKRLSLLADVPNPNDKWAWALGRLAVILRGADPLAFVRPGASTVEIMRAITSTCECPDLAFEVERLKAHWGLYLATGCKGTLKILGEPNVFAGLPLGTALAKYRRLTEDICDKSTGRLGSWWTPK